MSHHYCLSSFAWALRRFPTDSLRWRFLPLALRLCDQSFRQRDERLIKTRHGFRMKIDVSDWLGRHLFVTGEYERATTDVFKDRIQPGMTVLDIGGNMGYFSCLSSRLVGATGRVLSFEPVPQLNQRLRENLALNGFPVNNVHQVALSNEQRTSEFHVGPDDHTGVSSLRVLEQTKETIPVQLEKADDYLSDIQQLDFVKIDVEGAECQVLEGMQSLLREYLPDLVMEITPEYLAGMDRNVAQIEELLKPLGYQFQIIENEGLRSLPDLSSCEITQYNVLATAH